MVHLLSYFFLLVFFFFCNTRLNDPLMHLLICQQLCIKTFAGQAPVKENCRNSIDVPIFSTYSIPSSYFSVYSDEKAF